MTLPDEDASWEWVVAPEESSRYTCTKDDFNVAIKAGNRVCELRTNAGLSVQEVEDYAGISKKILLAIEAGLLTLDAETADQLAMVLGVSVAELTG